MVGAVSSGQLGTLGMHGTGTALGDPIEVTAASVVLLTADRPAALTLSAVKSYVGHTEGAAGTAGLVQALISLQTRAIAPVLHFRETNRHVTNAIEGRKSRRKQPAESRSATDLSLTKLVAGSQGGATGVSSFAFQGTNAHTIVAYDGSPTDSPSGPFIAPSLRGWDRSTYWYAPLPHELVDHAVKHTRDTCSVALRISHASSAWMAEHVVARRAVMPLGAFVVALAAVSEMFLDNAKERTALLRDLSLRSPVSASVVRGGVPLLLTCAFSMCSGEVFVGTHGEHEAMQHTVLTCQLGRAPNAQPAIGSCGDERMAVQRLVWQEGTTAHGDRSRLLWRGEVSSHEGYNMHPALLDAAVHMPSFVDLACNDVAAASVASAVEGCVLLSKCAGRSFTGDDDDGEAYSIRGAQSHHVHVQMVGVRTSPLERMASGAGALPLVALAGETEGATEGAAAEYVVNERLKGMEDEERRQYIHTFIRDAVTDAIGRDSPVDPDAELMEAGLDSLAFVDLRNKIVQEVGMIEWCRR